MAMDQKARDVVEKVDSCRGGRELGWREKRCCWGLVVLKMKVGCESMYG